MYDLLKHYQQGEHEAVWRELVALGEAVQTEPLRSEALAVAHEMMVRARHNVHLLSERLKTLGYHFDEPRTVWEQPDVNIQETIESVERDYGMLPIVVRTWFEVVGNVNFIGAHPKLCRYEPFRYEGAYPPPPQGPFGDPLVIDCYEAEYDRYSIYESTSGYEPYNPPYAFEISPDPATKYGTSGGTETYVMIPCRMFDTILFSESWPRNMFFIPYLRECFAWGGFPGLRDDPAAAEAAREELAFLTQGLLPI